MNDFVGLFSRFAGLFMLLVSSAHAEEVICHYTYGGETKAFSAPPVTSPYAVKSIAIGSYFHFRVVFQKHHADIAAIKVYTYAEQVDSPILIHQATYPYPLKHKSHSPYGFTGLQFVYEPVRDGELHYWCELPPSQRHRRKIAR